MLHRVHRDSSRWTQRYTDPHGGLSLTLDQALEQPDPAQWRAHHETCDPDPEAVHYRIPAAKLRIRADLLDWTAHLLEKNWLPYTDWQEVIRETRTGGIRFAIPGPRPSSRRAV
ncbi:hypothetical protein ACFXOI_32265 [Streptomyces bacillaris]|uniref:hypothetical protein n=1 Tax=Streptomyces bacillaris TaxID=68179 RepID=UPI00368098FD